MPSPGEAAAQAAFSGVLRYAQCWEDADVLLDGLDVQPDATVLSIASAGDNTLSLLTRQPGRVIAVDINPAQIAALELRVAAYRTLEHAELLELVGSRPSTRRIALYEQARECLTEMARTFWDARRGAITRGIGSAGRFEHYLALFRQWVLPLVHSRGSIEQLLAPRARADREVFYDAHWNTRVWRALFRGFFSEFMLGRLGRDPSFFRYVDGSVSAHLLARTRHALVTLDPAENPYVQWILLGRHAGALPHSLRPEHFDTIRDNLDRLEWHGASIDALCDAGVLHDIDCANLSNIFEYMSESSHARLLERIADASHPGTRLLYWNMMVPRSGAVTLPQRVRALPDLGSGLFARDKAFFYRALVVEEIIR